MMKTLFYIALLAFAVCGCTTGIRSRTRLYSDCDLDRHVGERVVLVGELVDHKSPRVHGVHVGHQKLQEQSPEQAPDPEGLDLVRYLGELTNDHAVVYHKVMTEGVLIRVSQDRLDPFSPVQATNTWYELIDPWTGELAEYEVIEE